MGTLSLLADEHVDSTYVTALRSASYDIATVGADYPAGRSDAAHLDAAADEGRVLLTNDRDFVVLGERREHAGIVMFDQGTDVRGLVRGIERIERYVSVEELRNHVVWLDEWLP